MLGIGTRSAAGTIGALAAVMLAGCGGSSGGGDSSSSDTGTASFSVTDAPTDEVSNVYVSFDRVDIKPEEGEIQTFELDEPKQIDLLSLQGENAEPLIQDIELAAGQYNWVRLFVQGGCGDDGCQVRNDSEDPESTDSFVVEDGGGEVGLFVPGDQPQSQNPNDRFVQLASPFTITAGGNADFTIDVELRKALTKPEGRNHYLLRPALRLVDNSEVGTISGTVDAALVQDAGCSNDVAADEGKGEGNAVYLYTGFGASPGDVFVDENGEEQTRTDGNAHPLTLANVKLNMDTSEYEYTIGFVPAGDYTVAFTCDALLDEPLTEDSESMVFDPQADVSVEAEQTTQHDFTAATVE